LSEMNGKTTKRIRQSMIILQGEYCRHCGKFPPEADVFLNRKDSNSTINSPENFQFLCRPCIAFRNKIERHDDLCVNNNDETAITINRKKEPKFRKYLYYNLLQQDRIEYDEIINGLAEMLELSPVTTKRYLDPMLSTVGKLKKYTWCGKHYVEFKSKEIRKEVMNEQNLTEDDL
jgi:hypothetical protein